MNNFIDLIFRTQGSGLAILDLFFFFSFKRKKKDLVSEPFSEYCICSSSFFSVFLTQVIYR